MIDSQGDSSKELAPLHANGRWSRGDELAQAYVDEALLQYVQGRVHVTLGQIQMPAIDPAAGAPADIEIRPVARLVFSESSFHRIVTMLNRVKERIPGPQNPEPTV